MLRSPIFWICCVAAVVATIVLVFLRRSDEGSWGFKEVVKNPELWEEMEKARERQDRAVEAAKTWTEERITKAVKHFVFEVESSAKASGEQKILLSLGEKTHAAIFQILSEDSVRKELTVPTGTNLVPEAPINRVCKLLDKSAPVKVVELLAPFLDDNSYHVRASLSLVIGSVGAPICIPLLKRTLADPEDHVRSFALIGLDRAVRDRCLDESCKRELFADMQRLVAEGKNADGATRLLLVFNEKRGSEFLLSPEILTPSSKSLHHALVALLDHNIAVPRDRLLVLIKQLETSDLKYPKDYAMGSALRQLSEHQVLEDRQLLEEYTNHSNRQIAEGAASGLIVHNGLKGFSERIERKEESGGIQALSINQRYYVAVFELDGEVNNGGLSQYFVNSSGDHWRDALAGLEAMGFKERTAILREAVGAFGTTTGPSANRDQRQDQLAKLERRNEHVFDDLDNRYFDCKEMVEVKTVQYVLHNPDGFK